MILLLPCVRLAAQISDHVHVCVDAVPRQSDSLRFFVIIESIYGRDEGL